MDIKDLVILNGDNVPTTTSLKVAESFGKEHKDVMRSIRTIIPVLKANEIDGCNFALVSYLGGNNVDRPMYQMDRKAYSQLVMSFTGEKATVFKAKFNNAFFAMEEELNKPKENTWEIPQTLSQALLLAGRQAEKIEVDAPKVEAYDSFLNLEDTFLYTEGFKMIKLHPNAHYKDNVPTF